MKDTNNMLYQVGLGSRMLKLSLSLSLYSPLHTKSTAVAASSTTVSYCCCCSCWSHAKIMSNVHTLSERHTHTHIQQTTIAAAAAAAFDKKDNNNKIADWWWSTRIANSAARTRAVYNHHPLLALGHTWTTLWGLTLLYISLFLFPVVSTKRVVDMSHCISFLFICLNSCCYQIVFLLSVCPRALIRARVNILRLEPYKECWITAQSENLDPPPPLYNRSYGIAGSFHLATEPSLPTFADSSRAL